MIFCNTLSFILDKLFTIRHTVVPFEIHIYYEKKHFIKIKNNNY